jgi:methylglutaconyl-CoA hydratase
VTGFDPGSVRADVRDGIATVRFGHPKSNSLPGALLTRLAETITEAGQQGDARVIVLASEGTGPFCAGASFDELKAVKDAEGGKRFFSGFAKVILAMVRCPRLVVARVQGKAVGGGVGLVAAADYAIASSKADVKLSELALGFGPFVVGPVIERKIGPGAFAALAADAEWRSADWARERGLYAEVHDGGGFDAAVARLAEKLAASNPEATARLKQIFWRGTEEWDKLLPERAALSGSLVLSEFARRAIEARG